MANDYKTAVAPRNAAMDALGARLNSGRIEIYSGTVATNVGDVPTGTLLGTLTFAATAFSAASGGTITAGTITSDEDADAGGDASYFRLYPNGAANTAADSQGLCGDGTDAPVDMQFNNKTVVLNGTIAISSLSITMPEQ